MLNLRPTTDPRALLLPAMALAGSLCLDLVSGCGGGNSSRIADASQPVEALVPAGPEAGPVDSPACPASCDDGSPCTVDSCDTTTFQCVHVPLPDGTSCQGRPCTTSSLCQAGICLDGPFKVCPAPSDVCHVKGLCSPATGECDNPNAPEGTSCDDGNLCTYADQCKSGVCTGTPLVCSGAGVACDPGSGTCPGEFPTALAAQLLEATGWPSSGSAIVKARDGQIFAAGSYSGEVNLGAGAVTQDPQYGSGNKDVFLAGIDPKTLVATWISTFAGPRDQEVGGLAVDGAGHLGVIGPLAGAVFVADNELDAIYNGDQFILGASTRDGAGLWARRLNLQSGKTDARLVGLRAIAGDPQGAWFMVCGAVACAKSALKPDAGPDPNPAKDLSPSLVCQGGTDLVVARVASGQVDGGAGGGNGEIVWADEVGGTNDEYCWGVTMDDQSNAYLVGTYSFGSTVAFGSLPPLPVVDSTGGASWMFIAKLGPDADDPAGKAYKWTWARSIGTGTQAFSPQALVAVGGDLVLAGAINGQASLQGVPLSSSTFIARFEGATGNLMWARGIGNGNGVAVNSMSMEGGRILVAGNYTPACASCALGGVALPTASLSAGFIAQVDAQSGAVAAAKGFGLPLYANSVAGAVALGSAAGSDVSGSAVLLSFSSKLDLGPPIGMVMSNPADGGAAALQSYASCLARIGP